MAAPAFGTAGTYLTGGTRTTSSVAVPASVANTDTIIVDLYLESSAAVTAPDGTWSELTPAPATTGTVTTFRRFIKRATAGDTGTYAFTHASAFTEGVATRYTGAGTAGALYDVINSASRSSNSTTTPAVTVTTTGADRLLVWGASSVGAGAWTPPTGYTERVDTGGEISVASVAQAVAGSSGSVTGTGPNGFMNAWLTALSSSILIGATASTTTISVTAVAAAIPPPLATYGFDGPGSTVTDDSGNGHSWTLGGTVVRNASGHTAGGLSNTGTGTAATLSASPAWSQTASRTVMWWMKSPASATEWALRWNVVSLGSGAWGFLLLGSQVVAQARNASTFVRAACTRPTDGLWHHYGATYDGTNVRMYLDAVLTDTQALTAPMRTDADTIDILELTSSATVVDDLRMYDAALSAAQISYLSGVAVTPAALTGTATTSTTTISTTAAAVLVGTAPTQTTSITVTAAAVLVGTAPTQTTSITVTAAARAVGVATSTTSITVTATAASIGTASSTTTIAVTAAARLVGAAVSTTTIAVTAAARAVGTATTTTTFRVTARARDANLPLPVAPFSAAAATVNLASGWSAGADPTLEAGLHAGSVSVG